MYSFSFLWDIYEPFFPIFSFWVAFLGGLLWFPKGPWIVRRDISISDIFWNMYKNIIVSVLVVPYLNYIPVLYEFSDTWLGLGCKLGVSILVMECWFYYIHRLLHTPWFYTYHKDHHNSIKSNIYSGLYCSMTEMVLSNQLSAALPFRLFHYTTLEMSILSAFIAWNVLKGHATLQDQDMSNHFFFSKIPLVLYQNWDHDNHHRLMKYNFGLFSILDRIHGTRYERDIKT
jgi:sterol desaturase/sphingolipid hydroxylase (fatty acid hydroxylase superfamily)